MVTFLLFSITGCGLLDKLLAIKEDFKASNQPQTENSEKIQDPGEIIVETPTLEDTVKTEEIGETKKVFCYFATSDDKKLVPVEKEISKVEGIARETIETLLEGPTSDNSLMSAIPLGTNLLDINVKDNKLCIVDFSKDLISGLSGGEESEKLAVYSIVNTLCQFNSVDSVEIRVDGQKMDTLLGHVDLTEAVMANAEIVKNK